MSEIFKPDKHVRKICRVLRNRINNKVLMLVSGGVDSTTSAALLKEAGIDSELLLLDTGFMRIDEPALVKQTLKKTGFKVKALNERQLFYSKQHNKSNPRDKRESFRKAYFQTIISYLSRHKIKWLAQGTQHGGSKTKLYHVNPTVEFENLNFNLIEPVRGLSKDQVRKLAKYLDLPDEIVQRRPFPGPGLLIRFGGEYTPGKLNLIRKTTKIVDDFVNSHASAFTECYQIFPYLCDGSPATFVNRNKKAKLGHMLLIRAIEQQEKKGILTYLPFQIKTNLQSQLVKNLMNLDDIARVCFDQTPKYGSGVNVRHGATIEYE